MTISHNKALRVADAAGSAGPDKTRRIVRLLLDTMREQRLAIASASGPAARLNDQLNADGLTVDRFKRLDRRGSTLAALAGRRKAVIDRLRVETARAA